MSELFPEVYDEQAEYWMEAWILILYAVFLDRDLNV